MQVRRSCYYSWRANAGYGFSVGKIRQTARIKECFYFHRRRYGSRRIAAELRIGRFRARSVMKREGLRAIAPVAVQAADDRFKARFSNQSESFTEPTECADGQRRGVCRRHNLFGCARRLLLSGLPSGQVHAANRRVAGIRADDGAARHRRVCFRAAARLDWQVRDYSHRPRQPVCFGRLPAASLHWRFPAIDVQARQLL